MTQIDELIGRLERATGPDRGIDEALMALVYVREKRHIGATENIFADLGDEEFYPVKDDVWVDPKTDQWVSTAARDFTASIDAALALVERLCGGAEANSMLYNYDLGWHASAWAEMAFTADLHFAVGTPPEMCEFHGQAPTLPLAILLALLRALSKDKANG